MRKLSALEEGYLEAAAQGDLESLQKFLHDGVNPNVQNREKSSAILLAAQGGHYEAVKYLAGLRQVDIDAQNQKCFNPFIHGCIHNDLTLVKIMVEAGTDLERLTRFGGNGLTPAAEKGHVEIVRYLIANTDINVNHTNTLGWTALIEAIILNDGSAPFQEVTELLLAGGADPHMTDEYGVAPVELARQKGFTKLVEIIEKYL